MSELKKKSTGSLTDDTAEKQWPGIDSRYRLIVVAALRSKQLLHGSPPRIQANERRHRNTSIALEEVRQGLVPFTVNGERKIERSNDGLITEDF